MHSIYSFHMYYIYMYITEKAMGPHSSTLAWKIPWMEEQIYLGVYQVLTVVLASTLTQIFEK